MPRTLLISDIHANLAALDAVLEDARKRGGFDALWSMGDAVGYGPQPNECVRRLQELDALAVLGNHELAALGRLGTDEFNSYAAAAAKWTASALDKRSREYLESLPMKSEQGVFTVLHGSPRDPIWEYITDATEAAATVEYLQTRHCIYGHTHLPAALKVAEAGGMNFWPTDGDVLTPNEGRWFINPGSVGQPRDLDPRASYALLDTEAQRMTFHRVEYNIEITQSLMEEAGLPDLLIRRLSHGR